MSSFWLLDGRVDNATSLAEECGVGTMNWAHSSAGLVTTLIRNCGAGVIRRFTGQFALALIDVAGGRVRLFRDCFGNRPLYYAAVGDGWAWASEIKCLLPLLESVYLDIEGLAESIHYRWLAGDHTLIAGVYQVLPSTAVTLTAGSLPEEQQYWRPQFQPEKPKAGIKFWVDAAEKALAAYFRALARQHECIGVLLSGGWDSSLCAVMARRHARRCFAVTPRFPGRENSELDQAQRVARLLDMPHRIVDCDDAFVAAAFPNLIWWLEGIPRAFSSFAFASIITGVRNDCSALVYGNAADASWGPSECIQPCRYEKKQRWLRPVPRWVRKAMGCVLPTRPESLLARLRLLLLEPAEQFALRIDAVDYTRSPSLASRSVPAAPTPSEKAVRLFYGGSGGLVERFQTFHLYTCSVNHQRTLEHLAAPFNVDIEAPFCSPEMMDLAMRLPNEYKEEDGWTKPVLRRLACRFFPSDWIYAPKHGFPTPALAWFQGPLRSWTGLLAEERCRQRSIFRARALETMRLPGDMELMWTAMSLECFLRIFVDVPTALVPTGLNPIGIVN